MLVHRLSILIGSSLSPKISPSLHALYLGNSTGNQHFGVHNAVGVAGLPKPPSLSELLTEEDNENALAWVTRFVGAAGKIPKELVELSFSRSSGPGGQVCTLRNSWTR